MFDVDRMRVPPCSNHLKSLSEGGKVGLRDCLSCKTTQCVTSRSKCGHEASEKECAVQNAAVAVAVAVLC